MRAAYMAVVAPGLGVLILSACDARIPGTGLTTSSLDAQLQFSDVCFPRCSCDSWQCSGSCRHARRREWPSGRARAPLLRVSEWKQQWRRRRDVNCAAACGFCWWGVGDFGVHVASTWCGRVRHIAPSASCRSKEFDTIRMDGPDDRAQGGDPGTADHINGHSGSLGIRNAAAEWQRAENDAFVMIIHSVPHSSRSKQQSISLPLRTLSEIQDLIHLLPARTMSWTSLACTTFTAVYF